MFRDRRDAGRRLAVELGHLRSSDTVVVGLPRGGVLVAREVAELLGASLDVVIVRKLGVPFQPELAMGAIGEHGVTVQNSDVVASAGVRPSELADVERRERRELERCAAVYRSVHAPIPMAGKTVIVVDDGLATGATARAACAVVRAAGARRVVLAVPVAPPGWTAAFAGVADELVAAETPPAFRSVGEAYQDFTPTSDDEVIACLG